MSDVPRPEADRRSRTIVATLRVLVVSLVLELSAAGAWAGSGSISGTVRNPNGSGRRNVIVTAIGDTGWARTVSGSTGGYSLANLEYGIYRVFFDPAPRSSHLAFQWSGGAEDPAAAPGLVISASTPVLVNVDVRLRGDGDGDGLSDTFESSRCDPLLGKCLDPLVPDSDGDGLLDGDEVNLSLTDPLRADSGLIPSGVPDGQKDSDGDLLTNAEELNDPAWARRTDPRDADTDNDGLTDFEEVRSMGGTTNPVDPDSDHDGVLDGAEDKDGDGLTNRQELDLRLNPREPDSDGDRIRDASEDADLDGLTTLQEITHCGAVFFGVQACANAYDSDTDNDGRPDSTDQNPVVAPQLGENPGGPYGLQPVAGAPSATLTIGPGQTTLLNPAVALGIDEAATSALALQVTVQPSAVGGYVTVLPAGVPVDPPVTPVWFNAGEQQIKYAIVKLGNGGDLAVTNGASAGQTVTVQALARWGRDPGTGHDRYQAALASAILDTGLWTASPPRYDVHPELAIPTDPTGRGDDLGDVERAVLLITHLPPAGATAAPFALDVAPGASGTPEVGDAMSGKENTFQQRIISVKLDHSGGPLAQLVHRGGRARLRVALLGYYVADEYFEAIPAGADPAISLVAGAGVDIDVRGIDGVTQPTFVLMSVTARNATAAGAVRFGGVAQVPVVAGATTTNTVLAPVGTDGVVRLAFDAVQGQTVEVGYDILGWFEHVTYLPAPFASVANGARFAALPAPVPIYAAEVGTAEITLPVTDVGGVPARGASQVVVWAQTWPQSGAPSVPSDLRVWGTGRKRPASPQLGAAPERVDSTVLVVDVGVGGRISLQASDGASYAEISLVGWLTPYTGSGTRTVAIVGDSLTNGAYLTNQLLGNDSMQINSYGLSGHTTHDLRPWADQIGFTNPTDAIVFLGTNDLFQPILGRGPIGHDPIAELRRYSTDHFPASTCVTYVANPFASQIRSLVAESPTRRNLIDLDRFLAANDQLRVTPRFPKVASYLKNVLRQYPIMAGDGIHLSGVGNEALALLYQQLVLGSTPGIGKTIFAPSVSYPNAVAPRFADYVVRTCH